MNQTYLRGDMYYADLGQGIGSEQEGYRPVVIIQNNVGNKHSPTVIIASVTSKTDAKPKLPAGRVRSAMLIGGGRNNCEPLINAVWVTLSVICPISISAVSIMLLPSVSV